VIDQTAEPRTPDSLCDLAALFQEGLLEAGNAEVFRRHLGTCSVCQGALQVGLLVESTARPPQKVLKFVRRYAPQASMALAASLLLTVSGRFTMGPVELIDGPTRPVAEWVEAPSKQEFRPYQRSSQANMGAGKLGDWAAYDQKQQRIGWLLRKRDRLLASAANALLHREENRAESYLHQLELLDIDDPALSVSILSNRAVLELQRADDLPGESCGAAVADLGTRAEQEGVCDERMRLLRKALGFIEKSLEKDPRRASALFNRGLVLERLGLRLSAAEAFEAAAEVAGPGWSEEAAREAARLRPLIEADRVLIERVDRQLKAFSPSIEGATEGDPTTVAQAKASVEEAIHLARRLRDASRDVEPLRTAVYDLARVGTSLQRGLLVPLAEALDGPQSALVRRLSVPGPVSASHERLVAAFRQRNRLEPEKQQALARELEQAGEWDLVLGLLSPNGRADLPVSDDSLRKFQGKEPYVAVRAGRFLGQRMVARGDEAQGVDVLRAAARQCDPGQNPERCAMVEQALAWSATVREQWSEVQAHQQRGFQLAERIAGSWVRPYFLVGMADASSAQNDPWLALAYAREARHLLKPCDALHRRVTHRMAAVRLYFFVDVTGALELMSQAVQPEGCDAGGLTGTGRDVLASLAAMRKLSPVLQTQLDRALEGSGGEKGKRQYVTEYWKARIGLAQNRPAGRASLEELLSEAEEAPATAPRSEGSLERAKIRSYAQRELALEAGAAAVAGDRSGYSRAFQLVARQLELKPPDSCALAVVSDLGQTVAVARNEHGAFTGDFRESGWRWVDRRGDLVVPAEVQGALRGCPRVQVLASPGVFGLSRLLADVPWSYAVKQEHAPRGQAPARRLVVANTDLPSALKLDQLSPLSPDDREPGTVMLQHRAATLSNVKRELETATEVELYTHGNQKPNDAEGSYLVLTPDPAAGGEFRLTGRDVRGLKLEGAPLVFLKACVTADAGFQNFEARSLASAFVERGARATFASTVSIPDVDADRFFNAVRERTRKGTAPAEALFEARAAFKKDGRFQEWMDDVVCLEAA